MKPLFIRQFLQYKINKPREDPCKKFGKERGWEDNWIPNFSMNTAPFLLTFLQDRNLFLNSGAGITL